MLEDLIVTILSRPGKLEVKTFSICKTLASNTMCNYWKWSIILPRISLLTLITSDKIFLFQFVDCDSVAYKNDMVKIFPQEVLYLGKP